MIAKIFIIVLLYSYSYPAAQKHLTCAASYCCTILLYHTAVRVVGFGLNCTTTTKNSKKKKNSSVDLHVITPARCFLPSVVVVTINNSSTCPPSWTPLPELYCGPKTPMQGIVFIPPRSPWLIVRTVSFLSFCATTAGGFFPGCRLYYPSYPLPLRPHGCEPRSFSRTTTDSRRR